MLDSPVTEVYLLFYHSALQCFINFNKFLQREDPLIPVIHEQMVSFMQKLASKFVKVAALKTEGHELLHELRYKDRDNQLSGNSPMLLRWLCVNLVLQTDDNLFVGFGTRMCLNKLVDEGDISMAETSKFFQSARAFYVRAMEYALANLPLKDELLKSDKFVNIASRDSATFSQVEYFVQRYVYNLLSLCNYSCE